MASWAVVSASQPPLPAGPSGGAGLFPPPPPVQAGAPALSWEPEPAGSPSASSSPEQSGMIDELIVPYAYDRVYALVARHRSLIIRRLISLAITVVILIGLQVWRHVRHLGTALFGWPYWALLGVSLAISLAVLGRELWQWRRAKAHAALLRPAPAMVIDRPGVELAGRRVVWPQIAGLQARTLRFGGDQFLVHLNGGETMTLPFELLDVAPSALDSAARAFSGERIGVDFAKMDN